MLAPSEEKNHCSSRRKFRLVSASVTPCTERNSESIFSSKLDVLLDGDGEWINLEGRSPLGGHRLFRSQLNVMQFYSRRRFGDFNRARGGSFYGSAAQIVRSGETPGTVGDDTHSETK